MRTKLTKASPGLARGLAVRDVSSRVQSMEPLLLSALPTLTPKCAGSSSDSTCVCLYVSFTPASIPYL